MFDGSQFLLRNDNNSSVITEITFHSLPDIQSGNIGLYMEKRD
ncbi:hypothetical protein NIES4101_56760 [Calothrix sp. NIES-4101]|nr:hypothetical protein NIES4101_56760 [Calothrix sp. NIES-4101]